MSLVQALSDIDDAKLLVDYRELTDTNLGRAVVGLHQDYNEKAIFNANYRQLSPSATGSDMKAVFSLLSLEDQINLLYRYNAAKAGGIAVPGCPVENPRERDDRKLRSKVALIIVVTLSFSLCVLTGAVAVIGVRTGEITGGPVIDKVIDAATEIVKILFAK